MNNETLLVIFVGITGFALLVQAIVMLMAFITVRKTIVAMQSEFSELKTTALPILAKSKETLDKSKEILDRVAPKIEGVAADAADLARTVRQQTQEFQVVAAEILDRVHRQTSRVDNMFTSVIDGVEHTTNVVAETVSKPVRQATAMLAGAKAFLTALATRQRRHDSRVEVVTDQDMFV